MHVLQLTPHQGVGPVLLGGSRTEAREALSALGFPLEHSRGALDYFCESSIQVEYGPDNHVWFIGISASRRFTAQFQGKDVFSLAALDLFALAAASDNSGSHTFTSSEYCFPNQLITLWDADEQYDRQGNESRPVWAQVGIGSSAYAAAVAAIPGKV